MQYVNELIHDYRCFLLPVVVFVFGRICSGVFTLSVHPSLVITTGR